LEGISAGQKTIYISALCASSSIGWSQTTVTALASFLRFLRVAEITTAPLAMALPKLTGHRSNVPCAFTQSDFIRPPAGCD